MRRASSSLVGLAVSAALVVPSFTGAASTGELRLRDRTTTTGMLYVEGAYQYVTVRRSRGHELVLRTRFGERLRKRLDLPAGYYTVRSWTRTCDGNCRFLDPPTLRCRGTFRVRPGRYVTATIVHGVGVPCRVTNP